MDKEMITGGYVRTKDHASRLRLIEYLEGMGYSVEADEPWDRGSIVESDFPVKIDIEHKRYGCLHNTASAAAACSSGVVFDEEFFYERMIANEEG